MTSQQTMDRIVSIGARVIGFVILIAIIAGLWWLANQDGGGPGNDYERELDACIRHQIDEGASAEQAIGMCGG